MAVLLYITCVRVVVKGTEWMELAQDRVQLWVVIPDPTYVFSRNHGEGAVDGFPVHTRVVGAPEQRHAVRCGLPTGLADCNSALRVRCDVRLGYRNGAPGL
jgi:hypothetical protein